MGRLPRARASRLKPKQESACCAENAPWSVPSSAQAQHVGCAAMAHDRASPPAARSMTATRPGRHASASALRLCGTRPSRKSRTRPSGPPKATPRLRRLSAVNPRLPPSACAVNSRGAGGAIAELPATRMSPSRSQQLRCVVRKVLWTAYAPGAVAGCGSGAECGAGPAALAMPAAPTRSCSSRRRRLRSAASRSACAVRASACATIAARCAASTAARSITTSTPPEPKSLRPCSIRSGALHPGHVGSLRSLAHCRSHARKQPRQNVWPQTRANGTRSPAHSSGSVQMLHGVASMDSRGRRPSTEGESSGAGIATAARAGGAGASSAGWLSRISITSRGGLGSSSNPSSSLSSSAGSGGAGAVAASAATAAGAGSGAAASAAAASSLAAAGSGAAAGAAAVSVAGAGNGAPAASSRAASPAPAAPAAPAPGSAAATSGAAAAAAVSGAGAARSVRCA